MAKKVKPVAALLLEDSNKVLKKVSREQTLRDPSKIGHSFTKETLVKLQSGRDFLSRAEIECFKEMIVKHGKAFAFQPRKIGCVDRALSR